MPRDLQAGGEGGEAGEGGQGLGWGSRVTRPHLETSDCGLIGPLQQRVLGAWRLSPGLPHPVKRPSPFSLISGLGARWAMPGRGREGNQVCGRASAHQGSAAPGRPGPAPLPSRTLHSGLAWPSAPSEGCNRAGALGSLVKTQTPRPYPGERPGRPGGDQRALWTALTWLVQLPPGTLDGLQGQHRGQGPGLPPLPPPSPPQHLHAVAMGPARSWESQTKMEGEGRR